MSVSLEWLGVSTYRLVVDDLVIFLDAYIDRNPSAPPVGIQVADVQRADYVLVGHSHFDHLWGAERIAHQTGATIIGSHESVRLMEIEEVPDEQLVAVAGGERIRLSDSVFVRVFPSQHSCIWSTAGASGEVCLGDLGLTLEERQANLDNQAAARASSSTPGMEEAEAHRMECAQQPRGEGGALAYLIETPLGNMLWKDTSGHWTGILQEIFGLTWRCWQPPAGVTLTANPFRVRWPNSSPGRLTFCGPGASCSAIMTTGTHQ